MTLIGLGIAATLIVVALGGWLYRTRREAARLRRRLDVANNELQHLQNFFTRFAPHDVVERLVRSGVPTQPERTEVTVLFADLVGFTALSESLAPEVLVAILNEYFRRMSQVISEHRGHVAKFIGDGLMALFGALEPNPWQTNDAVHAALAMRATLEGYNRELAAQGRPLLRFGVGIHRGTTIAGVIGSHELMEFTVVGSTVNLASRVEHLTRRHGVDIIVTAAVHAVLDPRFALRALPETPLRGVSEPVTTFAVEGFG